MLALFVSFAVMGQPSPSAPAPAAADPAKSTQPTLAEPAPLETLAMASISDRALGRGVGSYLTAQRMLDWALEANPGDADAIKRVRAQWEAEAKPGFEALIALFCKRHGAPEPEVRERFEAELKEPLDKVKARLNGSQWHRLITENRLDVRTQPSIAVSLLYMFDPSTGGDDGKLIAAGKTRIVRSRVHESGGPGSILELTVPMSWHTVTDKPGELTLAENAGMGPLSVTMNAVPLGPESPRDPLKFVALMGASGEERTEPEAVTLAGRSAGRVTTVISRGSGSSRVRARYVFTAMIDGERAVVLGMSTGAPAKEGVRDYTTADLTAYTQSRSGVIESIFTSAKFTDAPAAAPEPANPAPKGTAEPAR